MRYPNKKFPLLALSVFLLLGFFWIDQKKISPEVTVAQTKASVLRIVGDHRDSGLNQLSSGSGFIVSKDGLALTCLHVVKDKGIPYSATLGDGRRFDLKIIKTDALNDIALIQLLDHEEKPQGLPTVRLGDAETLSIGDALMYIPEDTAVKGQLIAEDLSLTAGGFLKPKMLSGLLQTDMPLSPGNSGSPLLDPKGNTIGMMVVKDTRVKNISFAIPSQQLNKLLE